MNAENDGRSDATLMEPSAQPEVVATATVPPPQPAEVERRREAESPVLAHLLEIADGYFAAGAIHQAMEIYFELASEHDDTPEGMQAGDRLMNLARRYVSAGKLHQARAIYERLV